MHQHHVLGRQLAAPAEAGGDHPEGGRAVEHDVGGVAPVVPGGEARVLGLQAGGDAEPAPGAQQAVEARELGRGGVEVLDHLGAGDEVVAARERIGVGGEEGIPHPHRVAGLAQHRGQRRSRAATVVQPLRRGREAGAQRIDQAREEAAVAGVAGVVAVEAVLGALDIRRRPLGRVQEGRLAGFAAQIVAPAHVQEGAHGCAKTDRAAGRRPGNRLIHAFHCIDPRRRCPWRRSRTREGPRRFGAEAHACGSSYKNRSQRCEHPV